MLLEDYQINAVFADFGLDSDLDLETQKEHCALLLADETANKSRISFLDQLRNLSREKSTSTNDFKQELYTLRSDGLAKFLNSINIDRLHKLFASAVFVAEAYDLVVADDHYSDNRNVHRRVDEIVMPTDDFVAAAESDDDGSRQQIDWDYLEKNETDPKDPRWAGMFYVSSLRYAKRNRYSCRRFSEEDVAQLATLTAMKKVNDTYTWKRQSVSDHTKWAFSELHRTHNGGRRTVHTGDNGSTSGSDFLGRQSCHLLDRREDVSSSLDLSEIRDAIDKALDDLTENQLLIVISRQFLHRSFVEISETLNLSRQVVMSEYRRAMKKLHDKLKNSGV